ncbi:MAG TPA: hypothetical protein VMT22_03685 [Terriglobales bacterium]|nr:hypothetical protein [Terriglobales bacterium]
MDDLPTPASFLLRLLSDATNAAQMQGMTDEFAELSNDVPRGILRDQALQECAHVLLSSVRITFDSFTTIF